MLDHLRSAPLGVIALVETVTRRALGNAASATDALREQNRARAALQPAVEDGRPRRAGELTRLPRADCLRLLKTRHVGRLAYVARAEVPDVVPVNYVVDGNGDILVRSGPGPKLLAAQRGGQIAFEVDDIDEAARTGWSVVVAGRAELVRDREAERLIGGAQPWAAGPRDNMLRITARRVEGRRLS